MKKYKLQFKKVPDPVTYQQVQKMRSYENFTTDAPSTSQILKRLSVKDYAAIIQDLENCEAVKLEI